ncbi:DUF1553 domain-containing protein [Sediminitomix flava]|uniref:Cytochrome c n=1 Tax=Sediminitomix flava TaxID=379075 RepID=A0A315Z8M6_SEDFL|nr:DUF1553 domain-containing protein [Sediminitomix flava]PWJ41851.1 cytochrome c [Sediminitomix flava]
MKLFSYYYYLLFSLLIISCQPQLPEDVALVYADLPDQLDFNKDVKPILSDKCYACHGPDNGKIEAGLQLHGEETAFAELPETPGKVAITPGNLKKSEVFHRIITDDPNLIMPVPSFKLTLSAEEKATLVKWIEDGANYEPHWAFVKPKKQDIPNVVNEGWVRNPIDHFILEKLENEELTPSAESSKSLLLRRLSLDLTGLPPTQKEIERFEKDESADAYEKQVDRLLNSSHYGEKMATDWMDLSRFADTHGYQVDRYRDMSPWRDWVIEAFNQNQPYDEFVTWQLAGDLLPNATKEQKLATAFNRLHPQNAEGGIVDEEFRVEYVADRTSVLGTAFLGMTVSCARCHDHKYDPISQKDFYELYSFFNNQNETGQVSWGTDDVPVPNLSLPTEEQEEIISFLNKVAKESEEKIDSEIQESESDFKQWVKSERYKYEKTLQNGLVASFSLDEHLRNSKGKEVGKTGRNFSKGEELPFVEGKFGKALRFNGDDWLDLKPVGTFGRTEAFSISVWVNIPDSLHEGVIFHKNKAVMLHCMKGYSLYLNDDKLELVMAHTYPDNAIVKHSLDTIPKNQWVQLGLTYDGSSKANGLKLFMNGEEIKTETIVDNLYKEIVFNSYEDIIYKKPIEPGLKIGARWRGVGLKGGLVDDIRVYNRCLSSFEVLQLGNQALYRNLVKKESSHLSVTELSTLREQYFNHNNANVLAERKSWHQTQKKLSDEMQKVKDVMVMKEMDEARQAYVLERGVYDNYGEKVFPEVPERIFPYSEKYPKNRLGLAQWLFDPNHPLTARVAVNRYWQNLFGTGIVKTSEDFGNQGELPSHKELLDWLSHYFIENEWDVKALHKLMVMSATYRQNSFCSEELREIDPENRLLARGPAERLTSEMLRDNILFASQLLNDSIGGESVHPYQPKGLWKMNSNAYEQDHGSDLYRRSLYSIWKRTVPLPTQATFDQPERSECTVRRQKTNTPLQALVLMNDPAFVEASRKIGELISQSDTLEEGIQKAFMSLTGRKAEAQEIELLLAFQNSEKQKFTDNLTRSEGWFSLGEYQTQNELDSATLAANTMVAHLIMNSDATITKR